MTPRHAFRSCVLIAVAVLLACSESSRRPPTSPATGPIVVLNRLEMIGPTTVALGKTGEFQAIAHYSDNTSKNVTADASWLVSIASILQPSGRGVFTGAGSGETLITAILGGQRTSRTVIVVPEGTFRVTGTVRDAGIPVDAQVRVEGGPLGRLEVDAPRGAFTVYGVAGETRLTPLKNGYEESTRTVNVVDHQRIDLDLTLSRPRQEVSGAYRLTVTAAAICMSLPEDGRTRSYDADVRQDGPRLTVVLSGAEFVTSLGTQRSQFTGMAEPERVVFDIRGRGDGFWYYYYYYEPDILEVVSPGRNFMFAGTAIGTIAADGVRGTLNGVLGIETPSRTNPGGKCTSQEHSFVLTR